MESSRPPGRIHDKRGNKRGGERTRHDEAPRYLEETVPLFNVVIFLVILTIAILALIYWGGFVEESRNK